LSHVVLKLDVAVFTSIYFQTLWPNWLTIGLWPKKTSFVLVHMFKLVAF